MKKLLVLLLAVLLIGTFAACDAIPFLNDSGPSTPTLPPVPPNLFSIETENPFAPEGFFDTETDGHTVIHDLPAISLIDHDLADSDILEPVVLRSVLGAEVATVTIISDWDDFFEDNGFILNDAWAIEIYYFHRRHETAVESVIRSFEADKEADYFFPDSHLTIGDVHASADENMALLSIIEELTSGHIRVLLYLAQVVPGSNDVVLMDLVFFPHLWEAQDDDVLAALSHHIGIDLSVYMSDFVSSVV